MRTIVTGAAGFIGSHLCERLLADGHTVTGFDDLSVGRRTNISHLESNKRFRFQELDVATGNLNFDGIDWVFHLAARADIVPSITHPEIYHHANVTGTMRVCDQARRYGVKRLVYAASSSCYGFPKVAPTPESEPCKPEYPYALTKMMGEQYVLHFAKVYKLPAISLRLFNVYGPRARTSGTYGAVFGVFLSQLAHDLPLTIVGTGQQTRDFTFVDDVVDAFVAAAQSNHVNKVFNVGSGDTYSINKLVDLLGAKERVYLPYRPGEPNVTFADTAQIRHYLDWRPRVSFEEGVRRMKELVSEFKDAPAWTQDSIKTATKDWFKYLGRA